MSTPNTPPAAPRFTYPFAGAAAARKAAPAPLTPAGIKLVFAAFTKALASGIKRPKMRIDIYEFYTKPTSSEPHTIHVTRKGVTAGRIVNGEYVGPDAWRKALGELCADLRKAITGHGHSTGECGCCGRALSDPISVRLGIGPVCADRWGFQ